MPIAGNIYYRYTANGEGEKAPVVLIHGAGGTHMHWPANIRRLPGERVYALDLPGHGKSEGRGYQTIEAYAEEVLAWMAQVNLFRAVFVGHSMGGAIALHIAQAYPEHVIALGMLGSGARLRVDPMILENTAHRATVPVAMQAIIERAFSAQTSKTLVVQAAKRMAETRASVLHGDFLACQGFDVIAQLEEIRFPTLVMCGKDDEMTPVRYAQYLTEQLPNAELVVISDAGHMLMLEQPAAVGEALSGFLGGLSYHVGQESV